jgi:methyl-accepting chemotaxis protein
MKETRELLGPVKAITENLRAASASLVEIGVTVREQFHRVETMVGDTGTALRAQLERIDRMTGDVSDRVQETAAIVQNSVLRPVREVAAIAKGVGRGFSTFFSRKNRKAADESRPDEEPFI